MHPNAKTRTIHTGFYGDYAKEIIDAVLGQLSDGKWENTPGYDKYWTNFNVKTADDGEVLFIVNAEYNTKWGSHWLNNPFIGMTDQQFKEWYAKKLKAVMMDELRYNGIKGGWKRKNLDVKSHYLNYKLDVCVADVYCVYDKLLDRPIGITKYYASTMVRALGTKKTDEETAKAKSLREAKEAVNKKYDAIVAAHKEALEKAKDEALAKVNAQFDAKLKEIRANQKNELDALETKVA